MSYISHDSKMQVIYTWESMEASLESRYPITLCMYVMRLKGIKGQTYLHGLPLYAPLRWGQGEI